MAFWQYTGVSPEFFPTLGGWVNPGQVIDFGSQAPPQDEWTGQSSGGNTTPPPSNWTSNPGPATVSLHQVRLQAAGISLGGSSGAISLPIPLPSDQSYLSWSYDPVFTSGAGTVPAGVLMMGAQYIRQTTMISTLVFYVNVAAVTPVAGQCFVGLYDSTGTLLGSSADISGSLGIGGKAIALTTPVTVQAGMYWVAFLGNAATMPQLARANTNITAMIDIGASASTYRFAQNGTAQTALPATFNTNSNTVPGAPYWFATK
jgi:hypothetical protein